MVENWCDVMEGEGVVVEEELEGVLVVVVGEVEEVQLLGQGVVVQ